MDGDSTAQALLDAVADGATVADLFAWAEARFAKLSSSSKAEEAGAAAAGAAAAASGGEPASGEAFYKDVVVGALKRLEHVECVAAGSTAVQRLSVTAEGAAAAEHGSPERILLARVAGAAGGAGLSQADLRAGLDKAVANAGFSQGVRAGLFRVDKASKLVVLGEKGKAPGPDAVAEQLRGDLAALDAKAVAALKARKLIAARSLTVFVNVKAGPAYVAKLADLPQLFRDLTAESLASGAWKSAVFKPMNFNALGAPQTGGHLHPLLKVRMEYREIFLEMGFEEMPTNNFVESSFWNFDTLFQPQQHPARDAHDTFFLSAPAAAKLTEDPEYVQRVKKMHESGGDGSIGWRYDWSLDESKKNILRTHTTAVSSRMLYKLANQKGGFKPVKYFSIDRVFRNETVDATHLAEFHQIEGLVADYDLTLGNLMGVIQQFFDRLGVTNLRFKPAYNPYTEPSMEVFGYHEGLGKWVELGNSGVFRPEMLRPMGLPENVRVIAWGLSLERPTMIKYGLSNIRDLVGHKISMVSTRTYDTPMCFLGQDDDDTPASATAAGAAAASAGGEEKK